VNYRTLQFVREGEVAAITLDRPDKRNAISSPMIEELLAAFNEVAMSSARVVVITGAGSAFCAGMDLEGLRSLTEQTAQKNMEDSRHMANLFYRIYSFPKPVICAVNGPAIAGGCAIATLADFTLAVPDAKFAYTEVKIGFLPALVSVFLRRQVGEKRARDLLLSARVIDAAEALQLGLVTEIVPPEKLLSRARELASVLLDSSPASLCRAKQLLLRFDETALRAELEQAIRANADIRATADFREGLTSFLEKRTPKWTGH
jgi:methylglutaconyl-CoA hydratase